MARLLEIARLFLKLGTIGFGGPAVHLATMEEEVVERRKWLSHQQFFDMIGATSLIPGPNSTEVAMHIGYARGGFWGLVVGGACFILPAALMTTLFAWAYVAWGELPQMRPVLDGIKPAVWGLIVVAGWRLGRKALTSVPTVIVAVAVAAAPLAGVRELPALLVGAVLGTLAIWLSKRRKATGDSTPLVLGWSIATAGWLSGIAQRAQAATFALGSAQLPVDAPAVSLWGLGWFFLKVGSVLYGSGYVLIAYLRGELVEQLGWLSEDQLFDAIAAGQVTPGPILSTATFIGFVLMARSHGVGSGVAGAAVTTLAIFLPSFVLVAICGPWVSSLRKRPLTAAFLDAVNAASLGLMATVALQMAQRTFTRPEQTAPLHFPSLVIAAVSIFLVLRYKLQPLWLVLAGAAVGLLLFLLS